VIEGGWLPWLKKLVLWFADVCRCPCHTEKGARCGFSGCCWHAGEVYAEKWPTLPVVEKGGE